MHRWILFLVLFLFFSIVNIVGCGANQSTNAPIVNGWKQASTAEISNYRVQPDDSLYSIAWAFGMDYRDLARYNHLSEPYNLHVGQSLRMSAPSTASQPVMVAAA